MSIYNPLFGFCLISCFSLISALSLDSSNATAYEMLEKFNFPKGILPQGVESYVLNEDGSFVVFLSRDCNFRVPGGYSLNYKREITGKVSIGSLKELQGVTVKVVVFWIGVTEVRSGDEQLHFHVGPLSASFPRSNFEESPPCGWGWIAQTRYRIHRIDKRWA